MQLRNLLAVVALAASTSAQILSIPGLNLGLLQSGALVNLGLYANVLGQGSCSGATVVGRVQVSLLGLGIANVCACVNVLNLGSGQSACAACPAHAHAICNSAATCACECDTGYYATAAGTCVINTNCPAPNVLTYSSTGAATCTCAAGYISDGAGGCVLTPSSRSRAARHRRQFPAKHGQAVFAPSSSESQQPAYTCPDGETACPLPSGGFECIDTETSLNSCGGCVGSSVGSATSTSTGTNCLAIPGALAVQCSAGACHVGSCFKGWRHLKAGTGRCV